LVFLGPFADSFNNGNNVGDLSDNPEAAAEQKEEAPPDADEQERVNRLVAGLPQNCETCHGCARCPAGQARVWLQGVGDSRS